MIIYESERDFIPLKPPFIFHGLREVEEDYNKILKEHLHTKWTVPDPLVKAYSESHFLKLHWPSDQMNELAGGRHLAYLGWRRMGIRMGEIVQVNASLPGQKDESRVVGCITKRGGWHEPTSWGVTFPPEYPDLAEINLRWDRYNMSPRTEVLGYQGLIPIGKELDLVLDLLTSIFHPYPRDSIQAAGAAAMTETPYE